MRSSKNTRGPEFDEDVAATAVALSGLYGCRRTAERLGIHIQTVKRYRQYVLERPGLRAKVDAKRAALEGDWAKEIPGAIMSAVAFLQTAAERANPTKPDAIHAVAGAMKLLHEVWECKRYLDARLFGAASAGVPRSLGPAGPADRPSADGTNEANGASNGVAH